MRKPISTVQACVITSEVDTLPAYTRDSQFSPALPLKSTSDAVLKPAPQAALKLEPHASEKWALEAPVISPPEADDDQPGIDGLKFRIVATGAKHFFREVRFKGRLVNPAEKMAIAKYFEGRCLEKIRREELARQFKGSTYLGSLQNLVTELQKILCD